MTLKRPLRGGERGADVRMVQRALNRWAHPGAEIPVTGHFDKRTSDRLMLFQVAEGVSPADGSMELSTLKKLWPFFDRYGRWRYNAYRAKSVEQKTFDELVAAMRAMDAQSRGYLLGGGHGKPLKDVDYDDFLDCSSSSSKALYEAGIFPHSQAIVSGEFARSYGKPGTGKFFTVYANHEHVFIRLHRSRWWRFDTSPHAGGRPSENPRRGPRLRYFPRFTSGFTARHWPGM